MLHRLHRINATSGTTAPWIVPKNPGTEWTPTNRGETPLLRPCRPPCTDWPYLQAVPDACVELVIVEWTGRPPDGTLDAGGKGFALGNDALQLIEALVEADHDKSVCSVSFREGDADRGGAGFSTELPSLSSGRIVVREKPGARALLRRVSYYAGWKPTGFRGSASGYGARFGLASKFGPQTVAYANMSEYEQLFRRHLWPHLEAYARYDGPSLQDDLVLYLRSGDARTRLREWFIEWDKERAHGDSACAWVRRCVEHSGLKRVNVVTRHASGSQAHPDLEPLETWAAAHGVQIVKEPGNLRSDFAKLAHAPHLATDYSSLGLLAALVNTQLRSVYLPRIFRAVDLDAADDHGFTVPLAPQREVWLVLPVFNGSCAAPQRKAAMDMLSEKQAKECAWATASSDRSACFSRVASARYRSRKPL